MKPAGLLAGEHDAICPFHTEIGKASVRAASDSHPCTLLQHSRRLCKLVCWQDLSPTCCAAAAPHLAHCPLQGLQAGSKVHSQKGCMSSIAQQHRG